MKIKKRKIVILSFIFIIIALLVIAVSTNVINIQQINENIRKNLYGEPIDLSTGIINNEYFNISSNGTSAKNTTDGLNKAIEYASKNNIKNIKLEQGTYLVNGVGDRSQEKGILLKSNINLDLNNSKIIHETNGSIRYTIFAVYNVENVTISNGTLIGDRYTHNYNTVDSTHEWGFGIEIQGSRNINIHNLEIRELTGDGVIVSRYEEKAGVINASEKVNISNNLIYECRRQGITIGYAKNVKIFNNEIYNILGTSPASAIDIEPDDSTQLAENIEIYNNKLYNTNNKLNVVRAIRYVKNINIHDNEINGNISVYGSKDKIKIIRNKISNGNMYFNIESNFIDNPNFMNKIEMIDNTITNCDFQVYNVNDILIENNKIERTRIYMISSNVAIANNVFSNLINNNFFESFEIREGDNKNYSLYIYNNVFPDGTKDLEIENKQLTIYYDEKNYNEYKNKEFVD